MKLKITATSLALVMLFAGCATMETTAYKVTGTISIAVDAAMNMWGDHVRSGAATDAQQAQVKSVYVQYQGAMDGASKAVHAYYERRAEAEASGAPPPEFASVQSLLDALSANSDAVFDLIASLLPADKSETVKASKPKKVTVSP